MALMAALALTTTAGALAGTPMQRVLLERSKVTGRSRGGTTSCRTNAGIPLT